MAKPDPFFVAVESDAFQREHIAGLAWGRYAAIQVRDFMPADVCHEILHALERVEFDSYGTERVYPPVMRFGVGVSDHRPQGLVLDSYWEALRSSERKWAELGLPYDVFALCRKGLGRAWHMPVEVARLGGRELGPGVAREPNQGFIVHFDDALREFVNPVSDDNLVAQFAFNLYLSVPESGGETIVWRHRWRPSDEDFRLPNSYGFDEGVVAGDDFFELKPAVGQALLFDPRNFHAVRPSVGGRRIALGFSVGMTDTGTLVTWG